MAIAELFAYLHVRDAGAAIEFYKRAFGAVEQMRLVEPSGRIGHAELNFGGTLLMLADEFPECGMVGPSTLGNTSMTIHLHVQDADAAIQAAVEAGAVLETPVTDQFYGERSGAVRDPFGHRWSIGHHIEEVTPEEMQRRYTALFDEPSQQGSE